MSASLGNTIVGPSIFTARKQLWIFLQGLENRTPEFLLEIDDSLGSVVETEAQDKPPSGSTSVTRIISTPSLMAMDRS
jgi:hypothetical protein